ncbi:MAG: lysine--tRNA ligase [Parcubacteria group bacterium]|nr:lysine--tRNA ligase [Parcubacteria group bacterium]
MAGIEDLRSARLQKLERLQKAGFPAYPGTLKRTHKVREVVEGFDELAVSLKEVIITGRIRTLREHGGSVFFHVEDETGSVQAYCKKDRLGEVAFQLFLNVFEVGDIVQLRGTLFATKKGEKTLEVADYKMLSKSLLPLPEKWHGIQDIEERYRKRYLDLLFNGEIKKKFEMRSAIVASLRKFLEKEGFIEVETPILQPLYGGAEARPFTTHLNAFDMKMYLRIAPELYLKRLLVGGFEKVYEIGRVFRNEGVDRQHNPDFSMLEFYWAYADYKDNMKLTERLMAFVVKEMFGSAKFTYEGKQVDLQAPWARIEYTDLLKKYADIDYDAASRDALAKKAEELGIKVDKGSPKYQIADEIYKKKVRQNIWKPTFVIHHPAGSIPLAKPLDDNPAKLGTFQFMVAGGWELVKAYTELNDPIAQRRVFQEQESYYKEGMEEAQRLDEDFVEALEYGMPPATGFGMGIDRLVALLTNSHSLREVILFPTMKPKG